eukprot:CAMPEP_0119102402 /NCGR_PEP_ID=MMETSP1180-20130426/1162_1 /TAXON_ID=3052 ORGANISM="Chlamydomonas cf sp, Strain CCMP681" /NCGR_SAMPLE_ID=MMETSP1180 /ASSEMBLY_ACC=CAM_ASM_000741 /LENGTH=262 /DNA_ID=CAMNT_0007086689 /DNA_START=327 /DNA_END=1115 /DNA_ORIENTATION=-
MLLSPMPAVLALRKRKALGDLNPLPLVFTIFNCTGWIAYGCIIQNPWIPTGNVIGLLGGLFFTLEAMMVADRRTQDRILGILLVGTVYFASMCCYTAYELSSEAAQKVWSYQCMTVLLAYYIIPLSTMYKVIKTKNAVSFYLPLSIATVANGSMWALYGRFGVNDITQWLPNSIGAMLGVLQVALCLIYDRHPPNDNLSVKTEAEQRHTQHSLQLFKQAGTPIGEDDQQMLLEEDVALHIQVVERGTSLKGDIDCLKTLPCT